METNIGVRVFQFAYVGRRRDRLPAAR